MQMNGNERQEAVHEMEAEYNEYAEIMHNFYHLMPDERNRVIDRIHNLNEALERAKTSVYYQNTIKTGDD